MNFKTFLICAAAVLTLANPRPASAREFPVDESPKIYDDSEIYSQSYLFPVTPDRMHAFDKSLPLPEALRKLSSRPGSILPSAEDYFICSGDFALPTNEYVQSYLNYYIEERPGSFRYLYRRSGLYEDLIRAYLKQRNMPEELMYLCMLESAFNPRAVSPMKAVGLWQFIYATGRRYDLEINYWVDERQDPEKSTDAALRYLADLYNMFGDWHLAAASYNCGEDYVMRRLRRTGCSDYWCLVDNKALPNETRNYLPRIVAMAIIGQNPERFGFVNLKKLPPMQFSTVKVDDAVDLRTIAMCAGTTEKEIRDINPSLQQFCTPPGIKGFKVNVPWGRAEQFYRTWAKLTPEERFAFKEHKVEKGQSLPAVAAGYGTNYKLLASMNGLPPECSLKEGQRLIVPVSKDTKFDPYRKQSRPEPEYADPGKTKKNSKSSTQKTRQYRPPPESDTIKKQIYVVEPGDTMWTIAMANGISVDQIKEWNPGVNEHSLYYGDELTIYKKGRIERPETKPQTSPPKGPTRTFKYTVRDGDRCYYIARHYGIHSQEIIEQNKLDSQCSIRPGQEITLVVPKNAPTGFPPTSNETSPSPAGPPAPAAQATPSLKRSASPAPQPKGTHKVNYVAKPGDSLWLIARNHDTHVEDILKWNGLDGDYTLQPGHELVIYVDPSFKPEAGGQAPAAAKQSAPAAAKPQPTSPTTPQQTGQRGAPIQYRVKPGDSLWIIARNHDVHVSEIVAWNGLDSEKVSVGQSLTIKPGPGYGGPACPDEPKAAPAKKPSSSKDPQPGVEAKSSSAPRSGDKITYIVQPGDSLWGIARAHDTHVEDILAWNGMTSESVIHAGQELLIYMAPGSNPPATETARTETKKAPAPVKKEEPAPKPEVGQRGKPVTYVVKDGDSLWGIARKHDVHTWEIKQWNNMDSDGVKPGQKLTIKPGPGYQP